MPTDQQSPSSIDAIILARGVRSLLTGPVRPAVTEMLDDLLGALINLTNKSEKLLSDLSNSENDNKLLKQDLLDVNEYLQQERKRADPLELDELYELLIEVRQVLKDARHTELLTRLDSMPIMRRRR